MLSTTQSNWPCILTHNNTYSLQREVFSAAARQAVAQVLLRHSADLFLPFSDDESEKQRPVDNRPRPHVLVPDSEFLYRSVLLADTAKIYQAFNRAMLSAVVPSLTSPLHSSLQPCLRRNMHLRLVGGGGVQTNRSVTPSV